MYTWHLMDTLRQFAIWRKRVSLNPADYLFMSAANVKAFPTGFP